VSRFGVIVFVTFCLLTASLLGQSANTPSPSPAAKLKKEKQSTDKTGPVLGGIKGAPTNGPVTTEIYADDAFFDSNKNIGIFSGHVKVTDPRFTLQSEKLTVYITKGQNQGLEKAIAEGNVAVVRDRPDPNGGPPTRAVGRSDQATYIAATGNVELRGSPRVQEGVNTHISTSPDTVMVVNQNGQLTTHGPSRTEIRQEPKTDDDEKKNETKPSPSPKPSGTS
jgi:lipopolysaccharide transport protein LptA